ncbi:unnamed protein product [Chrysoparadoxa australica]
MPTWRQQGLLDSLPREANEGKEFEILAQGIAEPRDHVAPASLPDLQLQENPMNDSTTTASTPSSSNERSESKHMAFNLSGKLKKAMTLSPRSSKDKAAN